MLAKYTVETPQASFNDVQGDVGLGLQYQVYALFGCATAVMAVGKVSVFSTDCAMDEGPSSIREWVNPPFLDARHPLPDGIEEQVHYLAAKFLGQVVRL
jgi:hypothetical protein